MPLGEFENTNPVGRFRRVAQRTQPCGCRRFGKKQSQLPVQVPWPQDAIGGLWKYEPNGGLRAVGQTSLAGRVIPCGRNRVSPETRPVILGFQITVGRRFEHLAARKNRRLPLIQGKS
jgi:hypothetical protein